MPTKAKKLPSGNWRSVANLGKRPDGQPLRKSFTDRTAQKAYKKALAAEVEYKDKAYLPESAMTLAEAFDRCLEEKRATLSPSTIADYQKHRRNSLQHLMSTRLCDMTKSQIQREINREAQTKSPKYVRNMYGYLITILKMYRPGYELELHLSDIKLPAREKSELFIPTLAMIQQLISAADQRGDEELALAIMLAAHGGLRRSEICALTPAVIGQSSLSVKQAVVIGHDRKWHLKTPKSYAGYREIRLTSEVAERLRALIRKREIENGQQVFVCNPDVISKRFVTLRDNLKLPGFRFHDLRHYNVSVKIALGWPLHYIVSSMGHASSDMVNRVYGHIMAEQKNKFDDLLEKHFAGSAIDTSGCTCANSCATES